MISILLPGGRGLEASDSTGPPSSSKGKYSCTVQPDQQVSPEAAPLLSGRGRLCLVAIAAMNTGSHAQSTQPGLTNEIGTPDPNHSPR